MALEKCPHMTARCPHHLEKCNDLASNDCHHIKRTRNSMVTAAALLAANAGRLSGPMQEYLNQTQVFLREMGTPLSEE